MIKEDRPSDHQFSRKILRWYDRHRRDLPWRAAPGRTADPYHVWLSEIMLQQTTVAAVGPYYQKFLQKWPDLEALAQASQDEVLTAWAGLGYYSRARNLHKCAIHVAENLNGQFPSGEKALMDLPGIGPYTAAAISAIAFDKQANVVDGNIERVMARYFDRRTPLPEVKSQLKADAANLIPKARCGDYAQALMDLGATVCTPKSPKCMICPIEKNCLGRQTGDPASLPLRVPKGKKPVRYGTAFLLERPDGTIFLRKRPQKGLLGGMMEIPSTPWENTPWEDREIDAEIETHAPHAITWKPLQGEVAHTFTHFHLRLRVMKARTRTEKLVGIWAPIDQLDEFALPSVMKKIIRLGIGS